MRSVFSLLVLSVAAMNARGQPADPPFPASSAGYVGLWVTRWDFRSRDDVERAIDDAAWLGATDLLWQVRGQADAYYRSSLEPWGEELFSDRPAELATLVENGPGFDPLAVAIDHAHARGLRLHAWINAMPLWKGTVPPVSPRHPFRTHPEWRLYDAQGQPQPLNEHYVIVNPLLPAVQAHIASVCTDIASRYHVDGLHLDYIRFVSDSMKDATVYPADPASIEILKNASGHVSLGTPDDRAAMQDLVRQRVTDLVRRVRTDSKAARPSVSLSAAVWRRPDLALNYQQDAASWLRDGTLDRAFPMIYTEKDGDFGSDLAAWQQAAPGTAITPGIGSYKHSPLASGSQPAIAVSKKADGFAIFAYASLFESVNPNEKKDAPTVKERLQRRTTLRDAIAALRAAGTPPEHPKP